MKVKRVLVAIGKFLAWVIVAILALHAAYKRAEQYRTPAHWERQADPPKPLLNMQRSV